MCRAGGQTEDGGFLWRAMGSHFRFEGWLTKSNLHLKNISLLHVEAGLLVLSVDTGRPVESSHKSMQKIRVTPTSAVAVSI